MDEYIWDTEVFLCDWVAVFKHRASGEYFVFHNDWDGVQQFISRDAVYYGFNSKGYDQFILKGILLNIEPENIKYISDYIVGGGIGWECPMLADTKTPWLQHVDLMDDCQVGQSLKSIEGHLGMNIQETEVDFNLKRPLTHEELEQTIAYCKHDVDATEVLLNLRKSYLQNKVNLGKLAGLSPARAMGMTNAKLTAAMLGASPQKHDDERAYVYPNNLKREYIPQDVFDFFDRMKDTSVTDEELFKEKLKFNIGGCEVTLGYGGIHAAIPNYTFEERSETDVDDPES